MQVNIIGIKPQANNVDGFAGKSDRYFGTREIAHALGTSSNCGSVLAADLIVVSECP